MPVPSSKLGLPPLPSQASVPPGPKGWEQRSLVGDGLGGPTTGQKAWHSVYFVKVGVSLGCYFGDTVYHLPVISFSECTSL